MSSFYSADDCHNCAADTSGLTHFDAPTESEALTSAQRFARSASLAKLARNDARARADEARAKVELQSRLATALAALAALAEVLPSVDEDTTIGGLAFLVSE